MKHGLKRPSSFIVVTLRSTRHGACVRCGTPLKSFDEAVKHWNKELQKRYLQQLKENDYG